jgi:hypothetical protein
MHLQRRPDLCWTKGKWLLIYFIDDFPVSIQKNNFDRTEPVWFGSFSYEISYPGSVGILGPN